MRSYLIAIKITIIASIVLFIVSYLGVSFQQLELNLFKWSSEARFGFMILCFINTVITSIIAGSHIYEYLTD